MSLHVLYSSSDESDSICAVRVQDEGSHPYYVEVLVQGVLSQLTAALTLLLWELTCFRKLLLLIHVG